MKLKSLEVKGFKSFPDKINLDLDHKVTGIIGPNGCGKSNIIDAIRWVIGEQRIKNLRSDSLDDLIFNGSKGRRPSGVAEVSITFENTKNILPIEFTTVTISRRFFKTGESEYRLNGVVCRLRDIHSLLMDTGISSDSYAIIELGMVDDIIRDKEGSRRRMMEQASGITIYKARKREAEQKLNATDQDLERIEDLLFEITNNLKSLEQQAKRAERYHALRKEYEHLSVELAKVSLGDFNASYEQINFKKQQYIDEKAAVEASIAGEEASIQARKVELVDLEKDLHLQQKAFNEVQSSIRVLESERKLASQHLIHLKERAESLQQIIKQAQQQRILIEEQEEDLREKIDDQVDRILDVEEELEGVRAEYMLQQNELNIFRNKLDDTREVVAQLQQKRFTLEKQWAIKEQSALAFVQQKNRMQSQIDQVKLQRLKAQEEWEQTSSQRIDLQEEVKELRQVQKEYKNQHQEIENLINEAKNQEAQSLRKLDASKNEWSLLHSLLSSLEGYSESIQALQKMNGFKGKLFSEIFKVEKTWGVLLELYFGERLNYYVVETREEAQVAMSYLKKEEKGKVGFWILEDFKMADFDPSITRIGPISFDSLYAPLFNFLLANIHFIEDVTEITVVDDHHIFLVLNQQFLISKGFLYGGGLEESDITKIGRGYRQEALKEEITELEIDIDALRKEIKRLIHQKTQVEQLIQSSPLNKKQHLLTQLEVQLPLLHSRYEEVSQQWEVYQEELLELEEQMNDSADQHPNLQAELAELLETLTKATDQLYQKNKDFKNLEIKVAEIQQKVQMSQLMLEQEKNKANQWKQELTYKAQQKQDIITQIAQQSEQLLQTQSKISETDGKLNFGIDELGELYEKKEIQESLLHQKDQHYYAFRNQILEDEQAISGTRKKREQLQVLINELEQSIASMQLQVAGIKERLTLEFNLSLEEILETPRVTEYDMEELINLTEKTKKRIENIGAINPTAIEAYQEIKLRHDFIATQKNDLLEARNSLFHTIQEVERTANEKFEQTFNAVRENFIEVFKALFTEDDHADLKLTDPENIAASNIEIYAQPKGKRPSTLTQLSGGEKTLTSIAYLFAIYLIKPAPFCILDEVDAPLDDANVGKFTDMIRQFSDNSQFIMVTHNKQTMAKVDVIYGVTMQEPGVSKIVPVDFRNLAE